MSTPAWSRTNLLILEAAHRLGVTGEGLSSTHTDFLMRLRRADGHAVIISKTRSPFLTQVAQTLTNNKHVSRELLRAHGIPAVPDVLVDDGDDDEDMLRRVRPWLERHGSLVCKPNWGNRARGVSTGLTQEPQLIRARARARAVDLDEETLFEPEIHGVNLRVAVIGGRFEAAAEIVRPKLVGDGERSIATLVEALNDDERRGRWDSPGLRPLDHIDIEDDFEAALEVRGHDLDAPLPVGTVFEILSEEHETIDRTEELHSTWAGVAVRACRLLGVDVGGVDLRGPAAAFREPAPAMFGEAGVLEVNVLPALHIHALPTRGEARPVFEAFVRYCLQLEGAPEPAAVIGAVKESR